MSNKTRISIDQGILSPSGHVSKQSRKIALERTRKELFGNGLERPQAKQPSKIERKLRLITEYRELAERGMSPRLYRRLADKLESELNND